MICFAPLSMAGGATPVFSSSVDPVFDIIRAEDPSAFSCLTYVGRDKRQIWDKRVDGEPRINTYLFKARFTDNHIIEMAINPEFGSVDKAMREASVYTKALGQIPPVLRAGIKTFSVHMGRQGFHAGTGGMVFYSEQARHRIAENHLEESIFHESIHTTLDHRYTAAPSWITAQKSDIGFITQYGQSNPQREDLAETALFAYAIKHHPNRIPPVDTNNILKLGLHRIRFINSIMPVEANRPAKPDDAHRCL